jgi:hypothetical protein
MFFGVESGSKRMQRIIDKDLDLIEARDVLRENNRLGIITTASLIIGYPQETNDDLRDTVAFFSDAMMLPWVDPQLNILSPLAGTPVTNEYRDQLVLDENWMHISEVGGLQDPIDQQMIATYPGLFLQFYGFPYFTKRDMLQRLKDFLRFGLVRCGGLMRAVYLHTQDMMGVFEQWQEVCPKPDWDWFASLEFVEHFIAFCESTYSDSAAVVATSRFYRNAFRKIAEPRHWRAVDRPVLSLGDNFVLVDCECDINTVLDTLARGIQPPTEAYKKPVTVGVRYTVLNRSSILKFPPVALELLRHAEKGSTLAEAEADFKERDVTVSGLPAWKVVQGGVAYLERLGVAKLILPAGSASAVITPCVPTTVTACV